MITAEIARICLALGACAPFDRLPPAELLLVSRHVHRRCHPPGEVILPGGAVAERLVVIVQGSAMLGKALAPAVFDAQSALFSLPVRSDYVAGPEGVETYCLAKPHLFTIARECPDFIVGLAALRATAGTAAGT
ncbi:MAG: cyclic nucleotide-binding domain-containing protein [Novosphingobium sp.]